MKKWVPYLSVLFLSVLLSSAAFGQGLVDKSAGRTLYVPATYVDFSYKNSADEMDLNQIGITRLIIRNLDPKNSITVVSADFYSPEGALSYRFLDQPLELGPWATETFMASPSNIGLPLWDKDGGRPFFVVKWEADRKVISPIIESARVLMVRIQTEVGVAWRFQGIELTPGTVIEEKRKAKGGDKD